MRVRGSTTNAPINVDGISSTTSPQNVHHIAGYRSYHAAYAQASDRQSVMVVMIASAPPDGTNTSSTSTPSPASSSQIAS